MVLMTKYNKSFMDACYFLYKLYILQEGILFLLSSKRFLVWDGLELLRVDNQILCIILRHQCRYSMIIILT